MLPELRSTLGSLPDQVAHCALRTTVALFTFTIEKRCILASTRANLLAICDDAPLHGWCKGLPDVLIQLHAFGRKPRAALHRPIAPTRWSPQLVRQLSRVRGHQEASGELVE